MHNTFIDCITEDGMKLTLQCLAAKTNKLREGDKVRMLYVVQSFVSDRAFEFIVRKLGEIVFLVHVTKCL